MKNSSSVSAEYIRLHITPFNPTLLNVILTPSILPNARNISYHILETFPGKAYGYVDLPKMDADKIMKKLNGSILKGNKVKIEAARPKKEFVLEPEDPTYPKKDKPLSDSKKRKRGQETIPAAQIGDRSVKRGWTTPTVVISRKDKFKDKDEKRFAVKSKYTTRPECLFKTVLPPNVASNAKPVEAKEGKSEKTRKSDKDIVVHEFSKTTKYATFLRDPAGSKKTKVAAEFVEGKGWVDEDENVVEEVKAEKKCQIAPQTVKRAQVAESEDRTSEDESSEVSSSSDEESDAEEFDTSPPITLHPKEDPPTSSSGSSSEEDSESKTSSSEDESEAESSEQEVKTPNENNLPRISTSRPQSSSGLPSGLSIKIPDSAITLTPITGEVHPLEALYKRSRPDSLGSIPKPAPSFSFFGAEGDDDLEEEEIQDQVPLTPFTQKDFEFRGIRSAAPTPDTAHANKRFMWPTHNADGEDEDVEEASSPIQKESPAEIAETKTGEPESDFKKWFYENRGEANRAWKKRRKAVRKEKRQRENRKRNDRAF